MTMRIFRVVALGLLVAGLAGSASGQTPVYGLVREVWEGIPGEALSLLTSWPDYPDHPTSTNLVTDLFEAPVDALDAYGQRMHGYLVAPQTGDYVFWISSDDNGALYLSTGEDPANAQLIATVNTWTGSREWEWEANQRSAPIALAANRIYYIAALSKEGGGGDNLAVRWLLPDGTDQAPMVATNVLPYGIRFTPPVISEQPTNTTAIEGGSARFVVELAAVGINQFQWRRNGVAIEGARAAELVYGPVRMTDAGARFSCVVSNNLGVAESAEAVLTVTPDTTPPAVSSVQNYGWTQLEVIFSEPVAAPSAVTPSHYRISGDVNVVGAVFGGSSNAVLLTTSAMRPGTVYTLTVEGVTDAAVTPNVVLPETRVEFVSTEYAPSDLGGPPLAGSATPVAGGVDVRGSGDLGGTVDALHFAWQHRTGDFDIRARLAGFEPTDPFAKAGLMVRETLDANSRFVAALATPATVGCFFMARNTAGTAPSRAGYHPANYPETWLRLKRSGDVFSAYASHDGQAWVLLGSGSLSLPSTVYFGLAVTSRNRAVLATAGFRDVGLVSGASVAAWAPTGERLGPSSRQTPLVLSEILYHPLERADGRSAEFVELYNADLIAQDLTGHRLDGDIAFAFPDGFVLPAGGFAVVARDPAAFEAIYGMSGVLGPFAGAEGLPNDAGTVQLCNPQGAILLEVNYGSAPPWPVAADGGGHSLVLARPSYGEDDSRAWAASGRVGGSPGAMEAIRADPQAGVCINEILVGAGELQAGFIELYNHNNTGVDLDGCILTDDPAVARFRIPERTMVGARGFIAFDTTALGFGPGATGGRLFLLNSNATRVVDAIRYGDQERGVATGRFPDGTPEWRRLVAPSPDNENERFEVSGVVINEILYNPISGDDADEFIELHNRTEEAVDLAGWRFVDGIEFQFPAGSTLDAGGYVVVAKSRLRLLSNHAGLDPSRVLGDYGGALSNGGERVALAKPDLEVVTNEYGLPETNRLFIVVDEVTYATGGRWGIWSDGLGSSLELIDPHSDHLRPSNWADSDETAKAPWSTIEATGVLDNGDGGSINRLQIMLQGPGECLVDDVEVLPSSGGNRIAHPGFESGLGTWVVQGNHRKSSVDATGGVGDSRCLHVRAPGRGDTACNRIYIPIGPVLTQGTTATLRARVRWLKGWPEFMLRTRGSYLEAVGRMALPTNLGTPGARNSRAVANAGPALVEVTHTPALPAASKAVVVTVRPTDPDGVSLVRLRYRLDPNATTTVITMNDNGTGGDAVAGDGVYSGLISGRSAGTLIAYTVEATDGAQPGAATARYPADAPARECLIRWGETQPVGNLGVYRLWQRQADYNLLRSREPLANDNLDATFVYDDGRVVYNIEMRGKGSPWHSGSVGVDYIFTFPTDDRFLGARDVAVVSVGNLGNDNSAQREQAAFWIGRQLGVPTLHRRHVLFYENGARKQLVYEDTEEPNGSYVDRWWPSGEDGDLYKIEDWFEFDDGGGSFTFSRDATLQRFTTTGGAYKTARYRWAWRKRAVVESANNYTNLFNLVTAVNATGSALVPQVENQADIAIWMRVFALQHIVGNWDAYGYNRGKNAYLYKPVGGRFQMIPWDIDMVLGSGSDGPSTDIFAVNEPVISKLWGTSVPAFRRVYLQAYLDAVAGPLQNPRFDPIVDGRHAALTANGLTLPDPRAIKSWVTQRRNYLANRIASMDTKTFAITSNGGSDWSTSQQQVTLTGTAPLAVKTLEVNGAVLSVTWTTPTAWSAIVALADRTNLFRLMGYDSRGAVIAGASASITVTYTGPEMPAAVDQVVINEIQYNPAGPNAAFLELRNASTSATYDLSGWRLEGVRFVFPPGVVLGPGAYAVVAADRDGFAAAYGFGVLPVGLFPGGLQNDGERLRLVKPGGTPAEDLVVDEVYYANEPPWPVDADGLGPSLQLIDARQDNWRVGNWSASRPGDAVVATPGRANSVARTLPAFPPLFLNEVQPENRAGPVDRYGDQDPWVELHNPGTNTLDLSGFYLTSDYAALTAWAFPAGASLGPGEFLVVWVDGEPGESVAQELHTSFRLAPGNGALALVREQLGAPAVIDYINYRALPAGLSIGSYPDGQPQTRQLFHVPTAGGANDPGTLPIQVFINEWMASNSGVVLDPADDEPDDWFELYNAGAAPADLSAYTLTDDMSDKGQFVIPYGTVVPAGGFLLVWADEEPEQSTNGWVHADFRLGAGGDTIGLFTPDGRPVDVVTFGVQTNNMSEGRIPDGMVEPFVFMGRPTPGGPNEFATINQPPVLASLEDWNVDEGQAVGFTAAATDPDPGQTLTFSLFGAPPGAAIDPQTGVFSWLTTEGDGPGEHVIAVRVTDDGTPARWDAQSIRITVREVNQPPAIDPIPVLSVDERAPLVFRVTARDADQPAQALRFRLTGAVPEGAVIDESTGEFSWTPTEAQGPSSSVITVRVTDSGANPLTTAAAFTVVVRETDDPPEFTPVGLQTVDELSAFTLAVSARDPDTPPRAVVYSLVSGPLGLTFDEATGVLRWTPGEAQGPDLYNVIVRATEAGGHPSSTLAVSIVVNEANEPPALDPIRDHTVLEGSVLSFRSSGSDTDLPAQNLRFSLDPGAPAAASIDPQTGVFLWAVGEDVGPSTNRITVRVTDDALEAASAAREFLVTVVPQVRVVINEIMYHPAAGGAEYVELHNTSTNTTWPLDGWRLTGTAYAFPGGAVLAPGGFLVVARDLARFTNVYGSAATVLGNYANELGAEGGTILLLRAGGAGGEETVDEVTFLRRAPWPAAADGGGPSLQLIDPRQDNARVGNWLAVTGTLTNPPVTVAAMTGPWRYWQNAADPAPGWTNREYDDSAWPEGNALLYVEGDPLPAAKGTPLTLGPMSFLFRKRFTFEGNPQGALLQLRTVIDDGVVFYLNGKAFYWLGMDEGVIPARQRAANRTIGNATEEGPVTKAVDNLQEGENVLAAEVHQISSGSTDVVFGASVDVLEVRPADATPGAVNSVRKTLDPFPALSLNEVLADNQTGITDAAGDRDPWIEIVNGELAPVALDGYSLSTSYGDLDRWPFPAGATLGAGQYRIVWADAEPGEATEAEWHANFRLPSPSGVIVLSRLQGGRAAVVDFLEYSGLPVDGSWGYEEPRLPGAVPVMFDSPTPGGRNVTSPPPPPEFLSLGLGDAGQVTLVWSTTPGWTYRLEANSALGGSSWERLVDVRAMAGTATYTDQPPADDGARYYRVVLLP